MNTIIYLVKNIISSENEQSQSSCEQYESICVDKFLGRKNTYLSYD